MNIAAYIVLGSMGGLLLWASIKAAHYTRRNWRLGDSTWAHWHARDAAAYGAIGIVLVVAAWKIL